jgi:peptide/nickel transport system permease protein
LIPVITILALQFGTLLSGAVVTETVFSWPGVGRLAVQAIYTRDFAVVQVTVMITAVLFVLINLLTDVLYVLLDPRIRVAD